MKTLCLKMGIGCVLALAAALTPGCGAAESADDGADEGTSDAPEAREAGEAEEAEEAVAEAAQELTACYQFRGHGNNLWEQDYNIIMKCDCGWGYVRDFHNVWNNGHGSCNAIDWASPDPRDCRVLVHIHDSGGWQWGECNVQVEKVDCVHDKCATGVALSSTCSSCVSAICAVDPYCCNNSWDSICVGEVSSVCGMSCN